MFSRKTVLRFINQGKSKKFESWLISLTLFTTLKEIHEIT